MIIGWINILRLQYYAMHVPVVVYAGVGMLFVRVFSAFLAAGLMLLVRGGGFTPDSHEFYDNFVYRWRVNNKIWATFIYPVFLRALEGSIWMNKFLTLTTSMKIGNEAFIANLGVFRERKPPFLDENYTFS